MRQREFLEKGTKFMSGEILMRRSLYASTQYGFRNEGSIVQPDFDIAPMERVARVILLLRGQRVILDRELAGIYGATTKRLNEQVKRNHDRFPDDFMFQLTPEEAEASRSQIATLNVRRGQNLKYLPARIH